MAAVQVNVSVANKYLDRFSEVVERARGTGLVVEHALDTIGVISGSIEPEKLPQLEQVEGVEAVERSRVVRVPEPPPDSGH